MGFCVWLLALRMFSGVARAVAGGQVPPCCQITFQHEWVTWTCCITWALALFVLSGPKEESCPTVPMQGFVRP